MINLANYLKTQSDSLVKRTSVKATTLNLIAQKNRGTATVRIVADKTGVPIQTVKGVFEVYEDIPIIENGNPVVGENGEVQTRRSVIEIPYASNYDSKDIIGTVRPTEAQLQKLNHLTDLLAQYQDYVNNEYIDQGSTETNMGIRYRSCVTSFWAKVFSVVPTGGTNIIEEPAMYLCKHASPRFVQTFNECVNQQISARKDTAAAYLDKFVSNEVGEYDSSITISTLLNAGGTIGYSVAISLMDGLTKYQITQEDVDSCVSLSTVGWNFQSFDEKRVDELIARVQKNLDTVSEDVINQAGAEVVGESAQAPVNNGNPFAEQVQVQAPAQPAPAASTNANPFANM